MIRGRIKLVLLCVLILKLSHGQNTDQNIDTTTTTEPPTTTATPSTTTTSTTTTGTTTTTESPTTTAAPESTTSTAPPEPLYCGGAANGLYFLYGAAAGDQRLNSGDDNFLVLQVQSNRNDVPFKGQCFRKKFYISTNGHVCLQTPYNKYEVPDHEETLQGNPNRYCMAPFFMDLVTDDTGNVWYRDYDLTEQCTTNSVVETVKQLVAAQTNEPASNYDPNYILIVTWDGTPRWQGDVSETNTFQFVFTTSGDRSFYFYIYKPDGMGITVGDVFIGTIESSVANGVFGYVVDDNQYRTALDTLTSTSTNGELCYGAKGFSDSTIDCTTNELICKRWHSCELQNQAQYEANFASMAACPCTLDQALTDPQFDNPDIDLSEFSSGDILYIYSSSVTASDGKTCAYQAPQFNFVDEGRFTGSYATQNPKTKPLEHQQDDVYYRTVCCDAGVMWCNKYFEVRPRSDVCQGTQDSTQSNAAGDPHMGTLDKLFYTFNGLGEYILFNIDSIGFTIQARTGLVMSNNGEPLRATVFTAFVAKGTNFWMQAELNSDRTSLAVLAGTGKEKDKHTDYNDFNEMGNDFKADEPMMTLRRTGETLYARFPETGVMMIVTNANGVLQLILSVEKRHEGSTTGLLGNFDGNPNNDLIPRNTLTAILSTSSEETIFNNFGQTWLTSAAESEFYYRPGKTHESYSFPDFIPFFGVFTDEQLAAGRAVCGDSNSQCVYDLIVSNDDTLAVNTLKAFEDLTQKQLIADNEIPRLSVISGANQIGGNYYLYATVDVENTLQVTATDDGTVTTAMTSDIPDLQQTNNADGSITVVFTLRNLNQVSLSFLATDNLGAVSPQFVINIVVCSDCNSHGTCDFTNFRDTTIDDFGVAVCDCEPYWEGDDCESDFDGCADVPCLELQVCTDTPADANKADPDLAAFTCTPCPSGYLQLGDKCDDINECSEQNNPCTGTCDNTAGSYECKCASGYRLSTDMITCIDINECIESTDNCDQVCTNTVGSFTCSCNTGYKRNVGDTACVIDMDNTGVMTACTAAGCDTADGCTVDDTGNGVCFCNSGYTLTNGNTCSDINECDEDVCSQDCKDVLGSFTCSCYSGFVLDADKVTCNACKYPSYGMNCAMDGTGCNAEHATFDPSVGCVCNPGWEGSTCNTDVNECLDESICGDVNKDCTNNRGSYTCTCIQGYQEQDGGACADIDECAGTSNTCEQICTNTIGSFTCGCESGFNVDGNDVARCTDIDECASGTSGCEQLCVNIHGRFNCECNAGFELKPDRRTCRKLEDVCQGLNTKTCSDICTVENGAPVCSCKNGFVLGSDEQTCIDVNECNDAALNMCTVKSSCVNTEGGYTCSCAAGFRLENDQRTCTACNGETYGVNCAKSCDCGAGADRCDSVTGCVCKTGYTGEKCDDDKDECLASPTSPCTGANEICANLPGSYECRCQSGYAKDVNGNCDNINECDDSTLNMCSQVCTDNDGSYTCSCNPGFVQNENNCIDINECEGAHGCEQVCTNIAGSFRCSCLENFELNADKKTCSAIKACTNNPCTGGALCARVGVVDTCTCEAGYVFDTGSATNCVDVNECSNPDLNNCNQQCIELSGSYSCACIQDGYKLDTDQQTCIECEEGKYGDDCSLDCACETSNDNTKSCDKADGTCTCNPGWTDDRCATDINECLVNAVPCSPNAACVNTEGSFSCFCSTGYTTAADGSCSGCDSTHFGVGCGSECSCVAANTEDCNDVTGACTCKSGWTGTTCSENINECLDANICNDNLKTCTDTDGSYQCSCISGYTLNSENNCIDNNECLQGTSACTGVGQICKNTVPGFTCECAPGYIGTGTCAPCKTGSWGEQCANTCNCNATNSNECDSATGCVCKQGWTGINCNQDIDECTLGTSNCVANSVCTNTPGSFSCACAVGYASSNDQCVACTNNGHGASCSTPCDCIVAHTITPTQSCNGINGHCKCKAGWEGDRCETDVDECDADNTLCTGIPNQGCHNLNGSYVCSCTVGYKRQGDLCVLITNTTTITVPFGAEGIDMYIKQNLNVDAVSTSHDLAVSQTNAVYMNEAQTALTTYYREKMEGSNFRSLQVYDVNESSLNIYYKVIITATDRARQDFANATYDLLSAVIPLFDQNTVVLEMRVGSSFVDLQADPERSIKCIAYNEASGRCESDEECVLEDMVPVCRKTATDNFALILGLGVGLPLFLVAVLSIALCVLYMARRRRRRRRPRSYRSDEFERRTFEGSGFFPTIMPTKINTIGRNDPVYVPYSWDDESTVTRSSSDDVHRKRRRRRRDDSYPAIDMEPSDFVHQGAQNFSWDFMYNYIGPDEKYEIQRPRIDRRGFNSQW